MQCPKCGKRIQKEDLFCSKCGIALENTPEKSSRPTIDDSAPYVHSSDRAALKALMAIPGFTAVMKGFMNIWSEKQYRIENMSSYVRMDKSQLSEYYDMLPPICEKLRINIPEFYLKLDVNPNAYTYGDTKPFIVMTSGLLETLPHELIPTVLAHECGHIDCRHVLYTTMADILLQGASTAAGIFAFGKLVSLPFRVALYYWRRCSEFSADRAAILCDGSADKMIEVCLRLAGFDKDISAVMNVDAFLAQAQEYKEMVETSKWNKTLEFLMYSQNSHPLMSVRASEANEWVHTEEYEKLSAGMLL